MAAFFVLALCSLLLAVCVRCEERALSLARNEEFGIIAGQWQEKFKYWHVACTGSTKYFNTDGSTLAPQLAKWRFDGSQLASQLAEWRLELTESYGKDPETVAEVLRKLVEESNVKWYFNMVNLLSTPGYPVGQSADPLGGDPLGAALFAFDGLVQDLHSLGPQLLRLLQVATDFERRTGPRQHAAVGEQREEYYRAAKSRFDALVGDLSTKWSTLHAAQRAMSSFAAPDLGSLIMPHLGRKSGLKAPLGPRFVVDEGKLSDDRGRNFWPPFMYASDNSAGVERVQLPGGAGHLRKMPTELPPVDYSYMPLPSRGGPIRRCRANQVRVFNQGTSCLVDKFWGQRIRVPCSVTVVCHGNWEQKGERTKVINDFSRQILISSGCQKCGLKVAQR